MNKSHPDDIPRKEAQASLVWLAFHSLATKGRGEYSFELLPNPSKPHNEFGGIIEAVIGGWF